MRSILFPVALLALLATLPASAQSRSKRAREYRMGMSWFPYEFTGEAVTRTREFAIDHSDLVAFKMEDDGVPWEEALHDATFPGGMEDRWREARKPVPDGHKVLLSLSPVKGDAGKLAPLKGQPLPLLFTGLAIDDPDVIKAYRNYCLRAVKIYRPDYLCIAINATKIVTKTPKLWPAFSRLMASVRAGIKHDHPKLPVGVSHELPSLWNQQVAKAVAPTLRRLDFLGVSFYPHAGGITEIAGGRVLPRGANRWRSPLQWLRKFTRLPIAVVETGHSTRDHRFKSIDLELKGDPRTQAAYVADLCRIAERDRHLFVVWSLPIDCDKLLKALPPELVDFLGFMKSNGLMDPQLKPKPALRVWDRELRRNE